MRAVYLGQAGRWLSALALRQVSAGYGETVVIEDIDLTLAPGECISVIGRNGVGKSTLLATVMGQTVLHAGEIVLNGQSLTRLPSYRRALAGIGFVPQEREIFPSLTVRENLMLPHDPGFGLFRAFLNYFRDCKSGWTMPAINFRAASSKCFDRTRAVDQSYDPAHG